MPVRQGGNTWANKILYWLQDQRKMGNSHGSSVYVSMEGIANALGTYRRQAMLAVRTLERQGYVEVTRQKGASGIDLPNRITLLPMHESKMNKIDYAATLLGVSVSDVITYLDNMTIDGRPITMLTLNELTSITGYNGDPVHMLKSFVLAHLIVGGILEWS